MSVCLSVNPVFATSQELILTEVVSSLSAYEHFHWDWGLGANWGRLANPVSILLAVDKTMHELKVGDNRPITVERIDICFLTCNPWYQITLSRILSTVFESQWHCQPWHQEDEYRAILKGIPNMILVKAIKFRSFLLVSKNLFLPSKQTPTERIETV